MRGHALDNLGRSPGSATLKFPPGVRPPVHSIEDAIENASRALVFGMGGGGDVVGAIPTARLLRSFGVDAVVGGLAWERVKFDPKPGPRALHELEDVHPISDTVAWAGPDCGVPGGARFASGLVARALGERTLVLDVTRGAAGLRRGLDEACRREGFDLVVATDSGGDALALGGEPGLRSPLADAISLRAASRLTVPSLLGVLGWGSDGELTVAELEAGLARAARAGALLGAWGITPRVAAEMDKALALVPTEASRVPVEALRGALGPVPIRDGTRTVLASPAAVVTFYLDARVVAALAPWDEAVAVSESLDEANAALVAAGLATELDFERAYAARGASSYRDMHAPRG